MQRQPGAPVFSGKIQSDNYLKFLVKELKPFIDSSFSTLKDQQNTFIAGSSMGGLISMYAICEYPLVFGGAACLSTHWPGIFTMINNYSSRNVILRKFPQIAKTDPTCCHSMIPDWNHRILCSELSNFFYWHVLELLQHSPRREHLVAQLVALLKSVDQQEVECLSQNLCLRVRCPIEF